MGSLWRGLTGSAGVRERALQVQADVRTITLHQLQGALSAHASLHGIRKRELTAVSEQWPGGRKIPPGLDAPWDWGEIVRQKDDPQRFELSIWSGETLCGLGLGVPKKKNNASFLGVLFMEGNPNPLHPLKGDIALLVTKAADNYAAALGLRELRIVDPFPKLEEYYVSTFGFRSVKAPNNRVYCVREVGNA